MNIIYVSNNPMSGKGEAKYDDEFDEKHVDEFGTKYDDASDTEYIKESQTHYTMLVFHCNFQMSRFHLDL